MACDLCNFRGHVTRISGKLVPTNDGAFTWYKEPPAEISSNEGEAALYTFRGGGTRMREVAPAL
jgi:hypothetical protein